MSLKITATNKYGTSITYGLNDYGVALTGVTGMAPPKGNISTAAIATKDGSIFTNAQMGNRNIVLTFDITGVKPESQRTNIYYVFKVKEEIELEFQTNTRTAKIAGYVEDIQADPFARGQKIQISIICPEPYFLSDLIENDGTGAINIVTTSDTKHGCIITVTLASSTSVVTIENSETGQGMYLTGAYVANDVITIDTRQGKKSVKVNGVNALNELEIGASDWIELVPYANNYFTVTPNTANVKVGFNTHYEGL